MKSNTGKRVIVLVHTDELVQQAYKKIKDTAPDLRVGIVKAAQNEVAARVIVASVQSLRSAKRRAQIRQVGLMIIDECHHATAATYRAILEHYGAFGRDGCFRCEGSGREPTQSPRHGHMDCTSCGGRSPTPTVQVAGFTATLARGDKQKLSDIWQECTFQRGISFGIRRGYLLDVRGKRIVIPDMDLGNVKKSGGDYAEGSLAEELDRSLAPSIVASAYAEHAVARKGLGFAPTVESAHHFAEAFNEAGIPSAVVHGASSREERRLALKRLRSGDLQVVWNCGVLTEGFDEPTVSVIVDAAPTRSAPRFQQKIGRGLRPDLSLPADQRGYCLLLQAVPGEPKHDLRTLVDLSERRTEGTEIEDGQSLIELEEWLEEQAGEQGSLDGFQPEEYFGETAVVDFDPLNRTGIGAWLKTEGGTYFLPVGTDVYLLLVESEEPGRYDVAWLTQKAGQFYRFDCSGFNGNVTCAPDCDHRGSQGDLTEHRGLHLDMATSWAEELIDGMGIDGGLLLAGRKKPWRRKEPTGPQQSWCERRGIDYSELTRGDVSDLMTTSFASGRIDPIVAFMNMSR